MILLSLCEYFMCIFCIGSTYCAQHVLENACYNTALSLGPIPSFWLKSGRARDVKSCDAAVEWSSGLCPSRTTERS